jgi:branched-subunit amino acid aminotransferase/4-amino-4-deoxychorismate lyase
MEVPFSLEELCAGVVDLLEANGVSPCYIRPIILRGYGEIGVSPKGTPIEVYIANFPWGKYIAGAEFFEAEGHLHAINLGRVQQPLNVFRQAEDGRALR